MGNTTPLTDEQKKKKKADRKKADRKPRPASLTQRLLTVDQASAHSGIPRRSLWDVIAAGKLAIVKLPGQTRRSWIDRRDLDALIESSREVRA
jgi:hypothetical protein